MKVNERRTVVGGVDWPLCVPPQPWREIDAHALSNYVSTKVRHMHCQHTIYITIWNGLKQQPKTFTNSHSPEFKLFKSLARRVMKRFSSRN